MKIHVYLICFNEEKIIGSILEYYLGFCSKIFVFDNLSTDKSISIAKSYDNVSVIPFDTNGMKDNSKHVQIKTQAYKEYSREGGRYTEEVADWVICADMDEVLYHPELVKVLEEYKKEGVTVPQITGFNMVGTNNITNKIPILKQYKNGVRYDVFDKRAIFDINFDMSYSNGCHAEGAGFELMKGTYGYKSSNKYPIALLHYKHIGDLLYESAVKNYERFDDSNIKENSKGRYVGPGAHYKQFLEMGEGASPLLKQSTEILDEELNVLFSQYVATSGELGTKSKVEPPISEKDIDTIRDGGLNAEAKDIKLAMKLMTLANKLRPEGPLIKTKLAEYIKRVGEIDTKVQ